MSTPIATLEEGSCKAEIYEETLPGQFTIRYLAAEGDLICEEPLTGVSTYRQRENEIRGRLKHLCSGGDGLKAGDLSSSGEY